MSNPRATGIAKGLGLPLTGTGLATLPASMNATMKATVTRSPGMLLLGVWLILVGLAPLVPLIASLGVLLNVICTTAGVLILIGR